MANQENHLDGANGTTITASASGTTGNAKFSSVGLSSGAGLQYDTSRKMHGTASAHYIPASSGGWSGQVVYSLTDTSVAFRFYVYLTGLPSSIFNLIQFNNANEAMSIVNVTSAGGIGYSISGTTTSSSNLPTGTFTWSLNQWYRVEGELVATQSGGSIYVRVYSGDSTTVLASYNPTGLALNDSTNAVITRGQIGKNTTSPTVADFWIDDVAVNSGSTTPYGPYVPTPPSVIASSSVSGSAATLSATPITYDNAAPTYAWTQTAGPTVAPSSGSAPSPTVALATAGTYSYKVVITDDLGKTATDTATFTYAGAAIAPGVTGTTYTNQWCEVLVGSPVAGGAMSYTIVPSTGVSQPAPGVFIGQTPTTATSYTVTATEAGNANTQTFRFTVAGTQTATGGIRILTATADQVNGGTFNSSVAAGGVAASTLPITRNGTNLQVNGVTKRFAMANAYWLGLDDNAGTSSGSFPQKTTITSAIQGMKEMGVNLIRAHTIGMSAGTALSYETAAGVYSDGNLDAADWAVYQAKLAGLYVMAPLTDNWNYYHGGKWNFVHWAYQANSTGITDTPGTTKDDVNERIFFANSTAGLRVRALFKDYISHWLNHVNPYTGLAYKDDPTIAIIETGNEIYYAAQIGTNEWTQDIASYIKGIAPNKLVADGSAADRVYTSTSPGLTAAAVDIVGAHYYPQTQSGAYPPAGFTATGTGYSGSNTAVQQLAADSTSAYNAGKAFIVGEYPWTRADVATWWSAIEGNSQIDADGFWSFVGGTEVHGGAYGTDDVAVHRPYQGSTETTYAPALATHSSAVSGIAKTNGA